MQVAMTQDPKGKVVTKIMMQLEIIKIRAGGGMIKTKSNAITARVGEYLTWVSKHSKCKTFKLQDGEATVEQNPNMNAEPAPALAPNPIQ